MSLSALLPNPIVTAAVAAVGFACWFALLGLLALATRSPTLRPGPPPDPRRLDVESPALVDLLTGGWKLCEEAAAATVLDLAARRVVTIEEIGPELSLVRLGRGEVPGLAPYERRVYDHLCRLARDGVVATGALAEGTRSLKSWWKGFVSEVLDEARDRGLTRRRWSAAHRSLLTTSAFVPAGLAAIATFVAVTHDRFWPSVVVFGCSYTVLVTLVEKLNGERGTDLGVEVAGRWLGLREHLAAGSFAEQPAAAVTIWGRPLAYAAALGLAPRAVVSLPVASPADDKRSWSDYGGMWHVVDVRYRGRGPLGGVLRGRTALSGIWAAFLIGLASFVLFLVLLPVGGYVLGYRVDDNVATARAIAVLVAVVPLVMALGDLVSRSTVEGQVVRRRMYRRNSNDDNPKYKYWVAIDTGTTRLVRAYGIDANRYTRLSEGDVVSARVGRWLGRIYDVEVTTPSRHRNGPASPQAPGLQEPVAGAQQAMAGLQQLFPGAVQRLPGAAQFLPGAAQFFPGVLSPGLGPQSAGPGQAPTAPGPRPTTPGPRPTTPGLHAPGAGPHQAAGPGSQAADSGQQAAGSGPPQAVAESAPRPRPPAPGPGPWTEWNRPARP